MTALTLQDSNSNKATGPQTGAFGLSDIDQFVPEQRMSSSNASNLAIASASGTYVGTVHNQTVNLSSTFTVVLHRTKAGALEGCMEVRPPLYGSGALHGSISGSHLDFVVADLTFRGDASKNEIAGSYVVALQNGQQVGNFRLAKRKEGDSQYRCSDGNLVEQQTTDNKGWSVVAEEVAQPKQKPKVLVGIVTKDYANVDKRCAFLTPFQRGYCSLDGTVAYVRIGDQLTIVMSAANPRMKTASDIYHVRTKQGWVGWIDSNSITVEQQ